MRLLPWAEEIAIDFGTANLQIVVKDAGVVVREPTVIAYADDKRKPAAIGIEARRMLEREVPGVRVVRPVQGGVVAEFDAAVAMLRHFLQVALGRRPIISPTVLVSYPPQVTAVEYRALTDSVHAAGGGRIMTVQNGLAAALGAGLPVDSNTSHMIVDIGAGSTDISVVSLGLVTAGASLRYGGDDLDEAIVRAVKWSQGVRITRATAEEIKIRAGSVDPSLSQEITPVSTATTTTNGTTKSSADVVVEDLSDVLARAMRPIIAEISWVLEDLQPREQQEIAEAGIMLCGGGALLRGIDAFISDKLNIPVTVATDPMSSTILGLEAILKNLGSLSLDGRRFNRTATRSGV
jgi:rod shape-determining protein MreB